MISRERLKICMKVPLLNERYAFTTPPEGCEVSITLFAAEGPYSLNCVAKLVWDFDGQNEEILWSIRGSGKLPVSLNIPASDTDGIKKLAITCDNGELSSVLMSAIAELSINTLEEV